MLEVIGWIAWATVVYVALSFAYGCRQYIASGQGFTWTTGVLTLFWWVIALFFLVTDVNKLHIIWLVPVAFVLAQFIGIVGIPVISPLVM
ncbi:MAG: hypothetical protein RMK57_17045, partial [Bryobacterales bacterium]|nr:hypothetical protein [Bryobacterales bacterium]